MTHSYIEPSLKLDQSGNVNVNPRTERFPRFRFGGERKRPTRLRKGFAGFERPFEMEFQGFRHHAARADKRLRRGDASGYVGCVRAIARLGLPKDDRNPHELLDSCLRARCPGLPGKGSYPETATP